MAKINPQKRIVVYKKNEYEVRQPLNETIKFFNEKLLEVPPEYRKVVYIELEPNYEYNNLGSDLEIYYWRDETEEETIMRLKNNEELKKQQEDKERKMWEQLNEKFGK